VRRKGILLVDLLRAFLSYKMLLAILGVFLFCLISIYQYVQVHLLEQASSVYFLNLLMGLSMFKKVLAILAAVPFVVSFCNDWNTQYIRFVVFRSGLKRYAWSKITVCFLSSFIATFFGLLLFLFFLGIFLPIFPVDPLIRGDIVNTPFGELSVGSFSILYPIARIFVFALGNSFWVVCGLALTAYLPNRFVALLSPFIFSYLLEEITATFPPWLSLYALTRGYNTSGFGALPDILCYLLIFGSLIFLCGLLFSHQVKKRMQNESV